MFSRHHAASRGLLSCLALIFGLAAAGCASRSGARPSRAERMPTLTGQQTFFDGQITAEIKVGAIPGFDRRGDGAAPEKREGRRGPPGGLGGGMHGGAPDDDGDGPRGGGMMQRGGVPSGPPVMIHLRFTNHGSEPVELRIADFLSPLGNFVVRPETLTLAAGASAEVEPMASGLAGQTGGGEITLKLQIGDRRETKTVTLEAEEKSGPESGKNGQAL